MEASQLPLTQAAKVLGISPWTLRHPVYAGQVPCNLSVTKRRFIPMWWIKEQLGELPKSTDIRCALYVRESASENKAALCSQLAGLRR